MASSALVTVASPVLAQLKPAPDPFIENLIGSMSLEEKAGQLSLYADMTRSDFGNVNPAALAQTVDEVKGRIRRGEITGLFNGIGVAGARDLQKVAIEESPHGIPLIFAADIIHGLRTVFPVPLGEAAAFDPDLSERTARAAALEATAVGLHWTFAPMVDIARDQRWGRVVEGAGEDTYLSRTLAAARVKGFQGQSLRDDTSMLSTLKHFAAYGAVQGGMDYSTADIPETTLREVHLPPFHSGIEAGCLSVMSSFNDIAGVPSTANRHLLTDILRNEWGFRGLVVSDYTSEEELIAHGYASDGRDAAQKSLMAGCDMSMQSGLYFKHLPGLVRDKAVPLAVLDEAVRRVLRVKKALGLFANPYRSMNAIREKEDIRTPQTVALAREAARKSVVMLKNDNNLLPLPKSGPKSGQSIALIGPLGADQANLPGPWSVFPDRASGVTIEAGLRAAMADPSLLMVVKGSDIEAPLNGGIEAAVAAAKAADVVILAIGEGENMSGEAQSRTEISVPAPQQALAEAVAATGKPVIVLLRHGRALALKGAVKDAPVILATWFLGSETGHALADLIFGDHAPSGRLPVSFPHESGQEPFYYNHRSSGRPQTDPLKPEYKARYREAPYEALYPFGYGLSSSQVTYGATQVSAPAMDWTGRLTVSVTVTNSGAREVDELAQLYIHDRVASLVPAVRLLKGFRRITLKPGESRTVTFSLSRQDLAFVQADLKTEAESGLFDVWIAPDSRSGTAASFVLNT
ncbi:MAG: glycoside hydrolase family 3 N-terminal domain-containing protein [Asticcacaulis sp.]